MTQIPEFKNIVGNIDRIFERNPDPNINPCIGDNKNIAYKYRNNLDLALEEGLQEFYNIAIHREIKGCSFYIHPNVNLYIDVTTKCPYDCGFCIAKTTDGRESENEIDIRHIEKVIKWMDSLGIYYTCQITGGEPTCHSQFEKIYSLLPKTKTVINTNNPIISVFEYDHVNVSCHHYNSEIESEIFKNNRDRSKLKKQVSLNPKKVRLQCNIIGSYIDVFEEIMQYIAWAYHFLGITNISFSFLTQLPNNTMYQKSIIDYINNKPADSFNTIVNSIQKSSHWEFIKYRGGVACYYEIWKYKAYESSVTVQFKYSNNKYLDIIDQDKKYIPDFVLHTNGLLTGGWDQRLKIFDYSND